MNRDAFIRTMAAALGVALGIALGAQPAAACNRTAGCAMDVLLEGHDMMQDGQMAENMRAAQANVQAFRRQQAADQAAGRTPPPTR